MELSLNGNWQFREYGKGDWLAAVVPGCNYLDLMRHDKIEDPFIGTNEKDAYWVALTDWEYQRTFGVTDELLRNDSLVLYCDMLDTICDVYLNEKLIGSGNNCFRRFEWDVKDKLVFGENSIRIVFYSPVNYVKQKQAKEKCPPNNNGQNGIPHIRKPQCHFGWDWGPVLPPSGISGNIGILALNGARIDDIRINQQHENGEVRLNVSAEIATLSEKYSAYTLVVNAPNGDEIARFDSAEKKLISHDICIEKPQLWWTHELNPVDEQSLYEVTLTLKSESGETLDRMCKKIGLRTITLDQSKDEHGINFRFILNGVPIFAKGANRIPADSFINRYTAERLDYDLKAALFSNMNMIRIWGGGYYESDLMYDLCDRYGILLWQDFPFACQAYPFFDEEFLQNAESDIAYNVKRLRHHASLAIWNGNNEIESMSITWRNYVKYVKWTDKFFYNILPDFLRKYDDVTAYIPGSPCGIEHLKGFDRDNVGDTHLWAVWHGLQPMTYYRKRLTRFCSEFGFESLPDIKTIQKFAKPEDYSLTSRVFSAHQKCLSGNMKMIYYIASRFRLPKNFEDYIYLSQVCQQECIKDATEHWRRNKGRCNGSIYWQMNDCWPVCSWAGMDYYGNYKALQYTSRHFNAPLEVSIQDDKNEIKIFAINDTLETADFDLSCDVCDYDGGVLLKRQKKVHLESNQVSVELVIDRAEIKADEY
ncbi:MAG: glycoside hydrolase family 2 protein, partial [Ruminococcus sp.]|nr:glycoside hydrolase family 2 protein [Ruminococcus sp.]